MNKNMYRKTVQLLIAAGMLGINHFAFAATIKQDGHKIQKKEDKIKPKLKSIFVGEIEKKAKEVPLKAAYAEHVIGKNAIRNAQNTTANIQSILNRSPSISATTTAPGITRIRFRSFNSRQFSETFDGMSLNNMFNGGVTNNGNNEGNTPLALNDVQAIKVYNGVNNPSVNSYNSLGGTIGYEPRQPSNTANASLAIGGGSFDTFHTMASINTGSLGGLKSLFSYDRYTSKGWEAGTASMNSNYYYAGVLPYDSYKGKLSAYIIVNRSNGYTPESVPLSFLKSTGYSYQVPLSVAYSTHKDQEITTIFGDRNLVNKHLTLSAKVFGHFDHYHRMAFSNPAYYGTALFPYQLGNHSAAHHLPGAHDPIPNTYNPIAMFGSIPYGTDYIAYNSLTSSIGFSPEAIVTLRNNQLTLGGNVTYGVHHAAEYWYGSPNMPEIPGYNDAWDDRDSSIQAALFGQDEISLFNGSVHITPGLKYVYSDMTTSNVSPGYYRAMAGTLTTSHGHISPTIGVNWSPFKHYSIYASWGENTKFPGDYASYTAIGQKDKAGNYVIAPVKQSPEYVIDYELGARFANRGNNLNVGFYREDFENTFVGIYNPLTGITTSANGGGSEHEGAEVSGRADVGNFLGHWSIWGNYSYNYATFTSTSFGNKAGQPTAVTPHNLYNLGLDWRYNKNLRADLYGKYTSEVDYGGDSIRPGYFVLNMDINKTVPIHDLGIDNIKLSFNIINLLDKRYYPSQSYNRTITGVRYISVLLGQPRAFYGTIQVTF